MRAFKPSPSGRIIHLPDNVQRDPVEVERIARVGPGEFYACECHERMGNEFYFLPINSCLRSDKQCTHPKEQS